MQSTAAGLPRPQTAITGLNGSVEEGEVGVVEVLVHVAPLCLTKNGLEFPSAQLRFFSLKDDLIYKMIPHIHIHYNISMSIII